MTDASKLQHMVSELGKRNALPKHLDIASYGARYWTVCYDSLGSDIMVNESYTGFSETKEISVLKALTERVERLAFVEGQKSGLASCQTDRSDGFAAMPLANSVEAKVTARENALNEAIERYVWSTWWDNPSAHHQIIGLESFAHTSAIKDLFTELQAQCDVESIICISPKFVGAPSKVVLVIFARFHGGGYISGGACGERTEIELTFKRGLDELFRHGLATKRFKATGQSPSSFYEKRLCHFGFGIGDAIVEERLACSGSQIIQLPELLIDEVVPNSFEDLFAVHRCYFKDQPPFVGGKLERLCL